MPPAPLDTEIRLWWKDSARPGGSGAMWKDCVVVGHMYALLFAEVHIRVHVQHAVRRLSIRVHVCSLDLLMD